jgi:hypothetical protein
VFLMLARHLGAATRVSTFDDPLVHEAGWVSDDASAALREVTA